MGGFAAWPIQQAVYDVTIGDATLGGLLDDRIFDDVPEDAERPYLVIGEAYETPDNTTDEFGRETLITLHVWSDYRGLKEASAIADQVCLILDHQLYPIPGLHHVATRYEYSQTLRDPNIKSLRHIALRFRVVTEQE